MKIKEFQWFLTGILLAACGGAAGKTVPDAKISKVDATTTPHVTEVIGVYKDGNTPCTQPVSNPSEVWKRIELASALSENELIHLCGLKFVEVLSDWRVTPVDLLRPIVKEAVKDKKLLETWINKNINQKPKAAVSVVAMDIIGDIKVGDDSVSILSRAEAWKLFSEKHLQIKAVIDEAAELQQILSSVKKIHELRCALEVNPLGFAVSCTPILPAKEHIELTWHEEIQDGLFLKLSIEKCRKSQFCKKLQQTSEAFITEYRNALERVEKLQTAVFKEQVIEWLKLPLFSK